MIADHEILTGILKLRKPAERLTLAAALDIENDAELAGALSRLVREGLLDRIERTVPGKQINFVYWPSAAGKRAVSAPGDHDVTDDAPTTPPVVAPIQAAPPMNLTEQAPMPKIEAVTARRERIIAYLKGHPDAQSAAIAAHLNIAIEAANRDLWTMKGEGRIRATGGKPSGYQVVEKAAAPEPKARKPRKVTKAASIKETVRPMAKSGRKAKARQDAQAPAASGFRVALTSDDTLLMERQATNERVELQRDEISVLTAFIRRLDNVADITR